jgi:hypothetical protein
MCISMHRLACSLMLQPTLLLSVTFLVASRREGEEGARCKSTEPEGGAFAQCRAYYAELERWLAGAEAGNLRHADLEEQLQMRGRELLHRLHQDHLTSGGAAQSLLPVHLTACRFA